MSATEAPKPLDVPATETVETTPAPALAHEPIAAPVEAPTATEDVVPKPEGDAIAPVEEKKEEAKEVAKPEEKVVEPIYSGALGYKAPGLKKYVLL